MRSRAVSLPAWCSRSRRSGPPPASASAFRRRSSSARPLASGWRIKLRLASDNGASARGGAGWGAGCHVGRRRFLRAENADSKVRGEPNSAKEKNDAENDFRSHGASALQWRLERSHIFSCRHQNKHRTERHRDDQHSSDNRGKNRFHRTGFAAGLFMTPQRITQVEQVVSPQFSNQKSLILLAVDGTAEARMPLPLQRKPDQSSATRMESTGLEGSYLMLAGCPGTRRSRRTWLSRPVMSCAV